MKISLAKVILAIGLIFASQMSFAQGLPKNCVDEITAISKKNANFDLVNFSKDLVTEAVKVKAQLKLPFGKPADSKVTSMGMSVGCLKIMPENPAQLQNMLKDLLPGLVATAGQNALEQTSQAAQTTQSAQTSTSGLPKNCIDEIMASSKKNASFDLMNFSKDLVTETVKVKAQLKLPFGKPADNKVTDIGMSVGCLKIMPENPAQLQSMLKDLLPGLVAAAAANQNNAPVQGGLTFVSPPIEAPSTLTVNNLTAVVGLKIFVGTQGYGGRLDANGTYKLNLLKLCGGANKVYVFASDGYIYNKVVNLECNKNNTVNFGDGSWQYSIMEPQVVRTLMAVKYAELAKTKAEAAAAKAEEAAAEATAAITRKAIAAAAATADSAASIASSAAAEALEAAKNAELASAEALEAAKTNESIAQTNFAVDISGQAVKANDYAKSAEAAAAKALAAKDMAANEAAVDDAVIATKAVTKAMAQVEAAKAEAAAARAEVKIAREEAARAEAEARAAKEAAASAAADAAVAAANVNTAVNKAISEKVQTLGTTGVIIGPGILAYGLIQNIMASKSINNGEFSEAKEHVKSRDSAYIMGMTVLLAGTSIKIFF